MAVAVFDVETNIVDGTASPYHRDTRIVRYGEDPAWYDTVVAGHNIAFDLLHALRAPRLRNWALGLLFSNRMTVWDTMIVDYLYHAGRYRSPSLEETCARWDVPLTKDELITSYFESGRGADVLIADGYEERLRKYHLEDLRSTGEVAIRQMAALADTRLLPVVRTQLEALKLVILEQFCGLPIDLVALEAQTVAARGKIALLESELRRMVELPCFNPASNAHVAATLYGGEIEEEQRVPAGVFKSGARKGLPREKIERDVHVLPRRVDGVGSVDEHALKKISSNARGSAWVVKFCQLILEYRETAKLLGTYLDPIAARVAVSFDGRLHGDINMAVTNTGRKSSSGPNLQNIPPVVRRLVRASPGWTIVAADFKQLEVVAWAYLSGDPALRRDLLAGVDIHGRTGDFVERQTGTRPERTDIKRVNFGRIYGGGVRTLAAQSGLPERVVAEIVNALDSLYPVGAKLGDRVAQALDAAARPYNDSDSPFAHRQAEYELPTGRRLWFRTYDARPAPWNKDKVAWSYTQCKNRPVQSFATADIVPLAEAMVMRELQRLGPACLEWVRPLVSVHDELVFEVKKDSVMRLRNLLDSVRSNLVQELNARFSLSPPFDLPLHLEIGEGDNWGDAKP